MATAGYSGSLGNEATSRGGLDQEFMQLQSSNHPGMVMVSALLTGNNYFAWSKAIKRALTAKMKLDFIDGAAVRPPLNSDEFKRWNQLWLELEARFGECNSPMVYQLQREIGQVTQGNITITEYYTKIKRLWDELMCLAPTPKCVCEGCTYGVNRAMVEMIASNQLIQFLIGLSAVYDQACSQILLLDPLPFVTKAYSMLLRMEKQLQMGVSSMDSNNGAAYQVKTLGNRKKVMIDKRQLVCEHCHKSGHSRDTCFKLHGTPDWYKEMVELRKKSGGRGRGFSALISSESKGAVAEGKIPNIADIVRTEMQKLMKDDAPLHPLQVHYAQLDNFAGAVKLTPDINLTQVLHIPTFSVNLISDQGTSRVLASGHLVKNLYLLESSIVADSSRPSNSNCISNSCTLTVNHGELWHKRLGHLSKSSMKHVIDLPLFDCNETPCEICPLAKMHKLPFESSAIKSASIFSLNFCKLILTQFDKNIQSIHTDNGNEFLSSSFQSFLLNSGIIHQPSCAYTAQQNGVVERKHRTLLEIARWKSPYEVLYNKVPSYSHLRTIGCLCFSITPEGHHSKFDQCSSNCVFVGYPSGQKGYRVYDLTSHSIFVSRNIQFQEHILPFATVKASSSPVPLAQVPLTADVVDPVSSSTELPSTPPSPSPAAITHSSPSPEPRNYKQASSTSHWIEAMNDELQALEQNQTWSVVPLPADKRPIGCKWVYKTKLREDGFVERYKARLVAKGYTRVEGIDYMERFSPVAKAATVRLFLIIATAFSWPLHQININNTFLHGHLDQKLYMAAPEGYTIPPGHSEHDHCLFFKHLDSGFVGLLVYVDDVLIMAPSTDLISEIARSKLGTSLTQSKFIFDIIADCGLQQEKSAATPLPSGVKLRSDSDTPLDDPEPYRCLVGRLLYLCFTRLDISHGVQQLSQFLQRPCRSHWRAALHLVRYLKGCPGTGLFFPSSNNLKLQAFYDIDWASCLDSRRSLTGFAIFLGPALVSWKTKKQYTVSRSSAEAEYRSMAATVCELKWISYLLRDFGINLDGPIPFHCDNQAAIHIMANPVFHERTKHLDIDCHIVRNCDKAGFLLPIHVHSRDQVADLFTKPLSGSTFTALLGKLGLFLESPSPTCGGGGGFATIHEWQPG
ncbi:UNVERIFIED_CONTAM: Retrovirus-related Pol polyprotein from transposon RE2 [Sesamum indicum]